MLCVVTYIYSNPNLPNSSLPPFPLGIYMLDLLCLDLSSFADKIIYTLSRFQTYTPLSWDSTARVKRFRTAVTYTLRKAGSIQWNKNKLQSTEPGYNLNCNIDCVILHRLGCQSLSFLFCKWNC